MGAKENLKGIILLILLIFVILFPVISADKALHVDQNGNIGPFI